MERKLYLDLCAKASISGKNRVKFKDVIYVPTAYQLSFEKDGKVRHTAILTDEKTNTLVYCDLKEVKESD